MGQNAEQRIRGEQPLCAQPKQQDGKQNRRRRQTSPLVADTVNLTRIRVQEAALVPRTAEEVLRSIRDVYFPCWC